jgi:hypothetical protein
MSEAANVLPMQKPVPEMGKQIQYEIFYGKGLKDHPEVDISIGMEDSIHWFCRDKKFRVKSVNPDLARDPGAPLRLFYRRFPEDNPGFAYHVSSGPARPGTEKNYRYKPVFEFEDGTLLDPHIRTNP